MLNQWWGLPKHTELYLVPVKPKVTGSSCPTKQSCYLLSK